MTVELEQRIVLGFDSAGRRLDELATRLEIRQYILIPRPRGGADIEITAGDVFRAFSLLTLLRERIASKQPGKLVLSLTELQRELHCGEPASAESSMVTQLGTSGTSALQRLWDSLDDSTVSPGASLARVKPWTRTRVLNQIHSAAEMQLASFEKAIITDLMNSVIFAYSPVPKDGTVHRSDRGTGTHFPINDDSKSVKHSGLDLNSAGETSQSPTGERLPEDSQIADSNQTVYRVELQLLAGGRLRIATCDWVSPIERPALNYDARGTLRGLERVTLAANDVAAKVELDDLSNTILYMANQGVRTMIQTRGYTLKWRKVERHIPSWIFGIPLIGLIPRHDVRPEKLLRVFQRWWKINPRSFRYVIHHGVRAGFTVVLPLSQLGFEEYTGGRISEWDLDERHVQSGGSRWNLIQSITLSDSSPAEHAIADAKKRSNITAYEQYLFQGLIRQIAVVSGFEPAQNLTLIADGTREGSRMLRHLGFEEITRNELDGRPIFVLRVARAANQPTPVGRRLRRWIEKLYEPACSSS